MDNIPNHIAIIPDGNRRWAKAHRLNPWDGHAEGAKRFWDVSEAANELGVKYLTAWAGSYDNLKKRSKIEVNFLLRLLRSELANPEVVERLIKNKTRLRVIGEWKEFVDPKTAFIVEGLEKDTAHFTKNHLTLLFGYDGQREMLAAVSKLVGGQNKEDNKLKKITEANLRASLWTADLPDVDFVIRTGGEPHWSSGFMMWHTANSQFHFTEQLWPDFKKQELKKAVAQEYDRRERRLGK